MFSVPFSTATCARRFLAGIWQYGRRFLACALNPVVLLNITVSFSYGGQKVLAISCAFWSLFTCLTPPAARHSRGVLFICRVGLGLAEGMGFPSIMALISRYVGWGLFYLRKIPSIPDLVTFLQENIQEPLDLYCLVAI